MADPLSEIGAYASIAGVGVAGFLAWLVYHLDKKRRTQEEKHYKTLTEDSLHEILQIFTEVVLKSKADTRSEEENEAITLELDEYFKENYRKLRDLIRDTKIYLSEWRSLRAEQKANVDQVIESLNWLIETFYPVDKSPPVKMKRWLQNRSELNLKKEQVQKIVNIIEQTN